MKKPHSVTVGSHYNPRFVLKNFVDPEGDIHCYRLKERKWYRRKPGDAGMEKNLYRVTHPDVADPQALEHAFSEVEGRIGAVVDMIIKTSRLAGTPQETACLTLFVADSAFRVPRAKRLNEYLADKVARQIVLELFESPEKWRQFQQYCRAIGKDVPDTDQPRYVEMVRNGDVQMQKYEGWIWPFLAVKPTEAAIKVLTGFSWRLWICPDPIGACIVTSDTPVSLLRTRDREAGIRGTILLESGVAGNWHLATQVTIPLSKSHILVGTKRGSIQLGTVYDEAAWLNTITCWFASTVFASCDRLKFQLPSGQVTGLSHFATKLEQFRMHAPPAEILFPPSG